LLIFDFLLTESGSIESGPLDDLILCK